MVEFVAAGKWEAGPTLNQAEGERWYKVGLGGSGRALRRKGEGRGGEEGVREGMEGGRTRERVEL